MRRADNLVDQACLLLLGLLLAIIVQELVTPRESAMTIFLSDIDHLYEEVDRQ